MRGFSLSLVLALSLAIPGRSPALPLDGKARLLPAVQPDFDSARVAAYLAAPAWQGWNSAHGGNWTAQYDTLSDKPRRVYGGAIAWNGELETAARAFIASNSSLFASMNDRLRFVPGIANPTSDAGIRFATFDYVIDGVPVESAGLVFAVKSGNMIYWNSTNIADVPATTTAALSAGAAKSSLLAYAGITASESDLRQCPQLKLLPQNTTPGGLLSYRLVYEIVFETSDHTTWAGQVDAISGAVVAFGNTGWHKPHTAPSVRSVRIPVECR